MSAYLLSNLSSLSLSQRRRLEQFLEILLERNKTMNLTAIREPEMVRLRHFEDSLEVLGLIKKKVAERAKTEAKASMKLIDVGSGAGIPGIVLAIALPELKVVSLESTAKKARFQQEAAEALELSNFSVIADRAETIAHGYKHREQYDFATARAVAPLVVLAELTLPFLRKGGELLAWKGRGVDKEIAESRGAVQKLGGKFGHVKLYKMPADEGEIELRIVRVEKVSPTPLEYPRLPGTPAKNPLR